MTAAKEKTGEITPILPAEVAPQPTWVDHLVQQVHLLAELHRGGKNALATQLLTNVANKLDQGLRQAAEIGDVWDKVNIMSLPTRHDEQPSS